jgi:hypothetical protein
MRPQPALPARERARGVSGEVGKSTDFIERP